MQRFLKVINELDLCEEYQVNQFEEYDGFGFLCRCEDVGKKLCNGKIQHDEAMDETEMEKE